jgi:hypothetical protein
MGDGCGRVDAGCVAGARLKFVAGLLDGENVAALCRRFGVSCTTGCKILQRVTAAVGRAPIVAAALPTCKTGSPVRIETLVVRSKQELTGQRRGHGVLARLYLDTCDRAIKFGARGSGPPWAGQAPRIRRRNKATHAAIDQRSAQ